MIQIAIKITLTILAIVIFALFVRKIWTNDIDIIKWLRKPSDFIPIKEKKLPPNVVPSIIMLPTKYKPGIEVDGIIWKEEFETHVIKIKNNSEDVECLDLRIEIELPGAIISYKTLENSGSQDLTFSQTKLPAGIREKTTDLIRENIDYYTNNLSVNAVKLFPMAKFSINIILSQLVKDHGGTISIKYRYQLNDGEIEKKSVVYPINFLKDDSNQLIIDTENPITGKYEGHFSIIFKEPVIFHKDGTINKKE